MGKRSRKKRQWVGEVCVYCEDRPAAGRDHVIPRALFETKPDNLVTVPACRECNLAKSKDEDYLRDFLSVDLVSHTHPEAQRLFYGPVKRAIQGNRSSLRRIALEIGTRQAITTPGGVHVGHGAMIPIDRARVDRVLAFMVRGLFYHFSKECIPQDYVFDMTLIDYFRVTDTIRQFASQPHYGPCIWGNKIFTCIFTRAADNHAATLWLFTFYQGTTFVISTLPPEKGLLALVP